MPGFLELPLEIRLAIYGFIAEDAVSLAARKSHTSSILAPPALLQTCRIVRQEYRQTVLQKAPFRFIPCFSWRTTDGITKSTPIDLRGRPALSPPLVQRMQLTICGSLCFYNYRDMETTAESRSEWFKDRSMPELLAKFRSLRQLTIILTDIGISGLWGSLQFLYDLETAAVVEITTEKPVAKSPRRKYTADCDLTYKFEEYLDDDYFRQELRRIKGHLNEGKSNQQDHEIGN